MPDSRLVCVVDDDPQVRDSLSLMLGLKGYDCRTYDSGESFLAAPPNRPCCLILYLKMRRTDGLALQQAIKAQAQQHETISLTPLADTEVMRSAFIEHAVDFLEKPVVLPRLLQALDTAFERLHQHTRISETQQRLDKLTPRERDVYEAIVEGLNHREVGDKLQISPRTVEVHKARIMEKLGVTTLAELLRFALRQP